jgi:hypothetical protein
LRIAEGGTNACRNEYRDYFFGVVLFAEAPLLDSPLLGAALLNGTDAPAAKPGPTFASGAGAVTSVGGLHPGIALAASRKIPITERIFMVAPTGEHSLEAPRASHHVVSEPDPTEALDDQRIDPSSVPTNTVKGPSH